MPRVTSRSISRRLPAFANRSETALTVLRYGVAERNGELFLVPDNAAANAVAVPRVSRGAAEKKDVTHRAIPRRFHIRSMPDDGRVKLYRAIRTS